MATDTAPDAPDDLAQYVIDWLDRQDPQTLRQIATHAENLASWKEVHAEAAKEEEEDVVREDRTDDSDRPEGVPAKANIVEKNINKNRYYYQWREGEKEKSKYKGPVDAGD